MSWRVESVPIEKLNPAPYNPRKITKKAREGLAASLDKYGEVQTIVWNEKTGHVVGGHQRLALLKERGQASVVCTVVDLDLTTEYELNLTLNNPSICGEFDAEKTIPLFDAIAEARAAEVVAAGGQVQPGLFPGSDFFEEFKLKAKPPTEFPTLSPDHLQLDQKCPKCGYEW